MRASCWAATDSSPGARPRRSATRPRCAIINKAADWLGGESKAAGVRRRARRGAAAPAKRREIAARLMPLIAARSRAAERKVGHFTDAPEVLEFVNSRELKALAALGTSCPDHFLRTKIRPLVLPYDPSRQSRRVAATLGARRAIAPNTRPITSAASVPNCPRCATPTRSSIWCPASACCPSPRTRPRRASPREFYVNAINVMRGAVERRRLCRPAGAGGFRHRILAAGRGQAPAHAEAEVAGGAHRPGDRRRGRHRRGDARAADGRRRLRRARRHRRRASTRASPSSASIRQGRRRSASSST